MKPDETDQELLRLAHAMDDGEAVDWEVRRSTDPALEAGIQGLRDIEALASALRREPKPPGGASARMWLEPGAMLGRYPVEREAGRGGMGVVYLARDLVLDRPVALKLLPPDIARSPERLARFTVEAKLLASLNHPNIATIHGFEESDGHRFLVLEWVAGETLAARLARGPLPRRDALDVCVQIARGLAAAHEGGVIHRDLKPGNVMITPQGRIKVLDFGLARRDADAGESAPSMRDPRIQGTWGYVSPERLGGIEDHRADVFAFGCVLFECLTGTPAFPGKHVEDIRRATLEHEPDEGRLPADTPSSVRRLIASCVVKDPERRLGSISEAVRTIEAASGHRAPSRAEDAIAVPHRLPEEIDAFVGRENELGELAEQLRRGARTVTLLGAGGMGKTRLAVRYAWQSLEEWPGGVWFCDLTEARTRDGIAAAVAGVLGVPLGQADPVLQIGHAIAGRGKCLVLLDNFEQIVAHAEATVGSWLARAADARFVVTSREPLELAAEHVQSVDPLGAEPGEELFLERARAHRPGYEPGGSDVQSVREVVRLVEGMPLAIELAAARIRVMSTPQIVERMRERFRLLAGGGGGRHATMRAAIDGSWELLMPWEKAAFAQCSVFEGGFTLAAAEAVLDLSAWTEAPWIPDVIQALVDRSLLRTLVPERAEDAAETGIRFGLFVSMQEYAREKLVEEGAVPQEGSGARAQRAAEERHGTWYARCGANEEIEALYRLGGPQRRRNLVHDLDNLVVATRRAAARGDGDVVAGAYRAAWDVLQLRGPAGSAVILGREALAALHKSDDRRRVLSTLGYAEARSGKVRDGIDHLEEALRLHRGARDRRLEGTVLGHLGSLYGDVGRNEEARVHLQAAIEITRELGDRRNEGIDLARFANLQYEGGELKEARAHMEAALAIAREVGDENFESQVLGHMALVDREQGRMEMARAHFERALTIARALGNRRFEGIMLYNLGDLGDHGAQRTQRGEARVHLESSLLIAREVGSRSSEGHTLTSLGTLHLDQGRTDEAQPLFEAAHAIALELGERRLEGYLLGALGRMELERGRIAEARSLLAKGERILDAISSRTEQARLLCTRAELEHRAEDPVAARAMLAQAESVAAAIEARPGSELGIQLAKVRQAIARS